MKRNFKEVLKGIVIFSVTLFFGFGITALSFNLFDTLSQSQMKVLFAIDVIILLAVGSLVWLYFSSRKATAKREKELTERHNRRVEQRNAQMKEIEILVAKNKFAA